MIVNTKYFWAILLCVSCFNSSYKQEVTRWRIEKLKVFYDPFKSPLKQEDINTFKGLNYFEVSQKFKIPAIFEKLNTSFEYILTTNQQKQRKYWLVGKVHFTLQDTLYSLIAFASDSLQYTSLFIPFSDKTNGYSTYETGRYIDVSIDSLNKKLVLDFNYAYNPYCAYNDAYDCPFPPMDNLLNTYIYAGEKKFKN